ncbi:MAG: Cysteine--tRNA ligase [Legionellaceae bacterium]
MLKIYNTLSRQKEIFEPKEPGQVKLYVCGVTVYDYCHLGHARAYIAFDIISRYLKSIDYQVTYIRNITDIDDKIIQRAEQNNESVKELTERYIQAMQEDFAALNILPPTTEPRATHYIDDMIALIQVLLEKGYAYKATNGDIYYSVTQFPSYGCLSRQDLDNLRSGARVAMTDMKKDPLDFALWKGVSTEPNWDSPWGKGRPGWHIECSAMSLKCLGSDFDIHGGGFDLAFPHHENEIAQTEAATQDKMAKYWMHVGFLQIEKEKMSKSLGNFFTIREILSRWSPEIVRYFLSSSHYRGPINYSEVGLENAKAALTRFYTALRDLPLGEAIDNTQYEKAFHEAMQDDFNTPEALAVLFDLTREINRLRNDNNPQAISYGALLRKLANILGILSQSPEKFLQQDVLEQEIEQLINERTKARANKDWLTADKIRQLLTEKGIILEDSGTKTLWRKSIE